jgi:hypothetical protein
VGRSAQRTRSSVPENQFRRPRPGLQGERLTEILEPLPEPRETSTAPAREDEHRAAGSPNTRPRWTETRQSARHHTGTQAQQQRGIQYATEQHCVTSKSNREDEFLHKCGSHRTTSNGGGNRINEQGEKGWNNKSHSASFGERESAYPLRGREEERSTELPNITANLPSKSVSS